MCDFLFLVFFSFFPDRYTAKVLTPMIVYTIINFKLPTYVPYKEMATKACGVTASLALYPPGRDGAVLNATYKQLRTAYVGFLSNDANLVCKKLLAYFER